MTAGGFRRAAATDDPLHGAQEGSRYHAYYVYHCYLPLYVTRGEHVLCCRLRL